MYASQSTGGRSDAHGRTGCGCHNGSVPDSTNPLAPPPPAAPEWPPPTTPTWPPPADDGRGPSEPERKPLLKRIGAGIAALGALLAKLGGSLKALLLLLPKAKLLATSGSMLVSVAAYSLIWGWKFAAVFVALILVHEMGHVIQLRREGIPASAPVFIPFLGAVVWGRLLEKNALAEARVGLAGPILGSLGAAALLPLAAHSDFWRAAVFTGFFLNLINLIPVTPFDGGRAMAAMAPWMWFVGLGLVVALVFIAPNPFLLIFLLLGAMDVWRRWRQRRSADPAQEAYYRVAPRDRVLVAVVYLALIAGLVLGMHHTHLVRTFGDV
jgi:Zn-dependent protease